MDDKMLDDWLTQELKQTTLPDNGFSALVIKQMEHTRSIRQGIIVALTLVGLCLLFFTLPSQLSQLVPFSVVNFNVGYVLATIALIGVMWGTEELDLL